ncbi:hypothetical protein SMSP2_01180 [Limihaloglobus sulfuriphilus]|uniref:C_GCAxxG_C_C family protein n=1 Tax=Limihaloglobus sulfuriphilus TaxID=1851148 RepID=A0A1Q2ME52_9BACT|nr:C-GCAxxG-C-C family protein [Limihaloglobus sulfuriphilus]AQQ70818.1 hypothetical protein SMSP2_01180 [Limihaloglobus sulfuriphilus]
MTVWKKAGMLYHGKEGYNCAQALIKAFQDICGADEFDIEEFAAYGRGRVDGGLCSPLYAIYRLIDNTVVYEQILEEFAKETGSVKCREIKLGMQLGCRECIELAGRLLVEKVPEKEINFREE